MQKKANLLTAVASYYSEKLAEHGQTPRGVDWNGGESQWLRFKQLSKIIKPDDLFSINDLGCGYGSFSQYLKENYKDFSYLGIDISESMIEAAKQRYQENLQARFILSHEPDHVADYGIASGIFNVRLGYSNHEWKAYMETTLETLHKTSCKGFSFNCLTSYSDAEKMKDHLYYADPCVLFDFCKRYYSQNVVLLHDYGLYEFTILVKKTL